MSKPFNIIIIIFFLTFFLVFFYYDFIFFFLQKFMVAFFDYNNFLLERFDSFLTAVFFVLVIDYPEVLDFFLY